MTALRLLFLSLLAAAWTQAAIRVVGSDLLGPALTAGLADYARRNELEITVDFAGSRAAAEALRAGQADLAVLSFTPEEGPPGPPFHAVPLAYHVVVVLAPAALPLEQISFDQLARIFGEGTEAGLRRWGELGLTGEWAARPIVPLTVSTRTGLVQGLFRHEVLADGPLQADVVRLDSADVLLKRLEPEAGALGLCPPVTLGSGSGAKALAVARNAQTPAAAPTPEAVHRGDYPLRWPVYVVFRRTDAPRLFGLLRHLLDADVAEDLARAGFMPVPQAARNGQIFDLEEL